MLAKGLIHDLRKIGEEKASMSSTFIIGDVDRAARFTFPRSQLPYYIS
jgi:hypothetical protein